MQIDPSYMGMGMGMETSTAFARNPPLACAATKAMDRTRRFETDRAKQQEEERDQ